MGFDGMLLVFHDVHVRYLKTLGYTEFDVGGGKGLIMAEARVRIKDEIFPGDGLDARLGISDMGKVRFIVLFHVGRLSDGKSVADVETCKFDMIILGMRLRNFLLISLEKYLHQTPLFNID